jgi:selenocysteine lyase/cysteine desulfurase
MNNFDGSRYSRTLLRSVFKEVNDFMGTGEEVLIVADATLAAASSSLNLTDLPFHAIVLSFREMFGSPDLSALIIRNDIFPFLQKRFFGSGSVNYTLLETPYESDLPGIKGFEYGPPPLQQIAMLHPSFDLFLALNIEKLEDRLFELTQSLYKKMKEIDEKKQLIIYGNHELGDKKSQGPILTFNVKGLSPEFLIDSARENNFTVSYVCKENLGACLEFGGITEAAYRDGYSSTLVYQVLNGVSLGALRVSLGWATSESDLELLISWLKFNLQSP